MFQLAAEVPAPVLADLLGLAPATASRWAKLAARDWSQYAAMRRADSETPHDEEQNRFEPRPEQRMTQRYHVRFVRPNGWTYEMWPSAADEAGACPAAAGGPTRSPP